MPIGSGSETRFLHYSSVGGCGAAARRRLLRGGAGPGPIQRLRRRPLLPQQHHHDHGVEGIAFAGEMEKTEG